MKISPFLNEAERRERLKPPAGPVDLVLDTDAYNEIDDQFALTYALLSPLEVKVEALYAAPFSNERAANPAEGMEKSYEEIQRLLNLLGIAGEGFVYRGSHTYLDDRARPVPNEASLDLVRRASDRRKEPLYVVAIGAITNIATALLLEPGIKDRIVVVWLGGHALNWPHTREFNLRQDLHATRHILDCGVPLVHIPCLGVASHLQTTLPEIERFVAGRGSIGDYLAEIFRSYREDHDGRSKVLWDLAAVAYLIRPEWVPTREVPSPLVTASLTWQADPDRHTIRSAYYVDRDSI